MRIKPSAILALSLASIVNCSVAHERSNGAGIGTIATDTLMSEQRSLKREESREERRAEKEKKRKERREEHVEKLEELGRTGLDMSPGDPIARAAAERLKELQFRLDSLDK